MTNKIQGPGPQVAAAAGRSKSAEPAASASQGVPVGKVQASDSVRLTGDGLYMQQLERSLADVPVVSDKRVARVRQALADGTYQVNPSSIAARLLRLEWQLGGSA